MNAIADMYEVAFVSKFDEMIKRKMKNNKEFVESIKNLIAMSELDEAIKEFRIHDVKEFENEILSFSARHQRLLKEIRQDTIKREDANIEKNKICMALLELVNQIDTTIHPASYYNLDEELENVLALAETQSRRNGEPVTSTKYFFAALVKLHPHSLLGLLRDLEQSGAMPTPISDEVAALPRVFSKTRQLSACLTDTANAMNKIADEYEPIKVEEFFIDVAKYGKGSSVRNLRQNGIDVEVIDQLVEKHNIDIRHR